MDTLGKYGPKIAIRMGFGCRGMSGHYETDRNDLESIQTLRTAHQLGINFFDTANAYGKGHNEKLLGKAFATELKSHRNDLIIGTKCGIVNEENGGWHLNFSYDHILKTCASSLKNLGTDYIDIFYLHRQPKRQDFSTVVQALSLLLQEGKIRHVGLSEFDAKSIIIVQKMLNETGFPQALIAVQSELSLFTQDVLTNDVLNVCKQLDLALVAYSPLSRALLSSSNKISATTRFDEGDVRRELPRFQGDNLTANLKIRDELLQICAQKKCTLPQLALAWVMAAGEYVIPIPGTRKVEHLKENLSAISVQLSSDDHQQINKIMSTGVWGERYTEAMFAAQGIKKSGR